MKIIKWITFKKIIFFLVIVCFGILPIVTYILQSDNLTGITHTFKDTKFITRPEGEFLQGQLIKIEFKARENYLGQFSLRFFNYNRINGDVVEFRIKEKGTENWYYQNSYKTDQFQPNALFPFGFPIISNSMNKTYVVEVESLKGKPEDAITISSIEPQSSVIYQYSKIDLLTDLNTLSEFLKNKYTYLNSDLDLLLIIGKYINFISVILFLLYFLLNYINRAVTNIWDFRSNIVIGFGIFGLVFNAVFYYLGLKILSEYIAVGAYTFLVIGVTMVLIEEKRTNSLSQTVIKKTKKINK